ncbi:hypothetical protein [Nannocystis pusilla]|uniref:Uncharacterized protein n=1 Tax=Nannocystis pusilla TaxID=889268 RepID=A0ABS7TS31_9BACT|nr:hypothetical protein [Nannocystis pusilla]MBZ5710957.1 hypothetical protein [Nannocystis pusilla]
MIAVDEAPPVVLTDDVDRVLHARAAHAREDAIPADSPLPPASRRHTGAARMRWRPSELDASPGGAAYAPRRALPPHEQRQGVGETGGELADVGEEAGDAGAERLPIFKGVHNGRGVLGFVARANVPVG